MVISLQTTLRGPLICSVVNETPMAAFTSWILFVSNMEAAPVESDKMLSLDTTNSLELMGREWLRTKVAAIAHTFQTVMFMQCC